ncbi:MAG: fatty acid desaturase [Betaproteobacteria bacterium]|nr:fatty acid desaturase [Betaproteobacteria bacterium]
MNIGFLNGLIDLPWWGYIVVTIALTHVTIAAVTIFLHRSQAHRGLDLHPIVNHFFRFWLWLTTGMVTKEWVAIHRKHHAKCETADDPHSPMIYGIKTILLEGSELYRKESKNQETLSKYGHGTPDDWLERNVYTRYSWQGVGLMVIINALLFGPIGVAIWATQMLWIPIHAAGIINGIGHYWGYRHFTVSDTSTNIVPLAFWIGGEELHNNHHAFPTSARFSMRWYEFDLGWLYIRILEILHLAKVKKVAPRARLDWDKVACDLETVQAVIAHRYEIATRYARTLKATCKAEISRLHNEGSAFDDMRSGRAWARFKDWMHADRAALTQENQAKLNAALKASTVLETVYAFKMELSTVWERSTLSKEELVARLEDWCTRAEASGILALRDFSRRLRAYA